MTFDDYVTRVEASLDRAKCGWSEGQTYSNVLFFVRPDLAQKVRGSDVDPFHVDERVPAFLAHVKEHW